MDAESVESASSYILDAVIPNLVQEFNSFVCVPVSVRDVRRVSE